jgi:hypothetical protein
MRLMPLATFMRHTRAALPAPPIRLDEFDAGGIRGGFQRRFTRRRDDWLRFAKKSPLALSASALRAFEGGRLVRHRFRR